MPRIYTRDPTKNWANCGYVRKPACERCASESNLVVHHKDRDRTNNDPSNLETLCKSCHVKEHKEEISTGQRRPEVNARRASALSAAKRGKVYPKVVAAVKAAWAGEKRASMLEAHRTESVREFRSAMMKALMNDPKHIEKRRLMKEARRANAASNHD